MPLKIKRENSCWNRPARGANDTKDKYRQAKKEYVAENRGKNGTALNAAP
jgi:hypothetical protein